MKRDRIKQAISEVLQDTNEPLETKEVQALVEKSIGSVTRTKLFYRLTTMRGDGLVKGKYAGPGKGVWLWWRNDAFR